MAVMRLLNLLSFCAGTILWAACSSSDLTGVCADLEDCAVKAGTPFSRSECEQSARAEREKAETANCGDEYGDYARCVNGINLQCTDIQKQVSAECGASERTLSKCLGGAGGGGGLGNTGDLSALCSNAEECARQSGRAFSRTECENDARAERERAETAACGNEYGEYANCAIGLELTCSDDVAARLNRECGRQVERLSDCLDDD